MQDTFFLKAVVWERYLLLNGKSFGLLRMSTEENINYNAQKHILNNKVI